MATVQRPVVVDTNILFSALLSRKSDFAEILLESEHRFFVCELVLVELFKHKEKIVKASRLPEDDVLRAYYTLLRRITLFKEDWISPEHRRTAYALCRDIDETDTPHVALTLELDGVLWTGDNALKSGLKRKTNWRPEIIPGISGKWSVRGYKFPTSNLFILPVEEQGSYKKYSLYAIELLNDEWTSRCLLSGVMHYDEFRVSPDKRHIAAWTEHGWQCVTLDGELVGRWPTLEEWSLSPDSQWLAYSVSDNVDRSKRILTIRRIDGSDERKIYSYNYPDRHFFDKIYVGWVVSAAQ